MDSTTKINGPCVVLAGAGTGKTHQIVQKLVYLIEGKHYEPSQVVCITFSNEAANNLLVRTQRAFSTNNFPLPTIKTFHGLSAELLRAHGSKVGVVSDFKILDPDQAKVLLHRSLKVVPSVCHKYVASIGMAKDLGISLELLQAHVDLLGKQLSGVDVPKKIEELSFDLQTLHLKKSAEHKHDLVEEITNLRSYADLKRFVNTWRAYEKIKVKSSYLDYADLNSKALELLTRFPETSQSFGYIIVDEFQDTNKVQLDLLFSLASSGNIMIVGDMNQSIYRFRGAYKNNFSQFISHLNVQKEDIFTLARSFRSPNKILKAAHRLIVNNYERPEECFEVSNAQGLEGAPIEVFELSNSREEARKVSELVERELQEGKSPEDICVLFRTHQQGRLIKRALEMKNIPYASASMSSLLSQKAVKVVFNYLSLLQKLSKKEKGGEQAWWELFYFLNFPEEDLILLGKFIHDHRSSDNFSEDVLASLLALPLSPNGKILDRSLHNGIKQLLDLGTADILALLREIFVLLGFAEHPITKEAKNSFYNLSKFYDLAQQHATLYALDLSSFLYYLEVLNSLSIEIPAATFTDKGVQLMTLHATKGLEYKTVILTNLVQKRFPMEKVELNSLLPFSLLPELNSSPHLREHEDLFRDYERKNQLLEERRLCYVAFTRAKEKLILTYAQTYGEKKYTPSQFLMEIGYKTHEDFAYHLEPEQHLEEPLISPKPVLSFGLALQSDKFDDLLLSIVKGPEQADPSLSRSDSLCFSPSALLTFLDCQKRYEYKYVFHMPEKKLPSWETLRLGSFVHAILEQGVNAQMHSLKSFLDLAIEEHLKEDWQSINLDEANSLIRIFFERNKDQYSALSKTELELTAKIGGFRFIGFADRIDFTPQGIVIVDYKTGKEPISALHRNYQLGFYALASQHYGKVHKVVLDMLRQEKPVELIFDNAGQAFTPNGALAFRISQVEQDLITTAKQITHANLTGFAACPLERNCEFCNEYVYGL